MATRIEIESTTTRVTLHETSFKEQLRYVACETDGRCVIVDLRHCESLSSCELNSLITLHSQLRNQTRELILANLSQSLREIFDITRLDRLFHIDNGSLLT